MALRAKVRIKPKWMVGSTDVFWEALFEDLPVVTHSMDDLSGGVAVVRVVICTP
jgi:hypothetical protein